MPEAKVSPPKKTQHWTYQTSEGEMDFIAYAPNIIRVTYRQGSTDQFVPSGWGIMASPANENDWSALKEEGAETLRSNQLLLKINPAKGCFTAFKPNGSLVCTFLGGELTPTTVNGSATNKVTGSFSSQPEEHYFGLGQHQDGLLDLRGRKVNIWATYGSREPNGVPFLISTGNYALIWDNPSRTQVEPGVGNQTKWSSEAGTAVSFFLITGDRVEDIYKSYRHLTGVTPLPPKAGFGLIQSKARYASQKEILEVAKRYRALNYPCDMLVIDYLHWKKLGDFSLDPKFWPDPKAMNGQLHDLGFSTFISIWPDFAVGSNNYDEVVAKKLVLTGADGAPAGMAHDSFHRDACIDSTNPAARIWLWHKVSSGYRAENFSYYWMDESEPDVEWHDLFCFLGPCAKVDNVYPLMHNSALYDGQRSVSNERVLILTRTAYLGSQRNGTTFWSSDITAKWDTLRVQVPTGLNVCATGLPYWSSDTAGWMPIPKVSHPPHLLLDPSDARDVIGQNDDYPELFVRWTQFSTFCPTFRLHGNRKANEIWSFGKEAESILAKYLKLRYRLLPYLYSLGHQTEETGSPFMRALFMDFPSDPEVLTLKDEYMFGPAFLVAPITSQGTVQRSVYLPKGTDWYNYWTNTRYHGGQTITAEAPIETIPLYVRAGSVVPLGSEVQNTQQSQKISEIRIYQGADGEFALYNDDGHSYSYESGQFELAKLKYSDQAKSFTVDGSNSLLPPGLSPTYIDGTSK